MKPSLLKKLERGFFHVFNAKSDNRRFYCALLAGGVFYGGVYGVSHRPSDVDGLDGAAHAAAHQSTLNGIVRDAESFTVPAAELDRRSHELVDRLVLDGEMSEYQAAQIARAFLAEAGKPGFSEHLRQRLDVLASEATHLHDRRTDVQSDKDFTHASTAEMAREILDRMDHGPSIFSHLLGWLMYSGFVQGGVVLLLSRGSRRDDKLKQEARNETLEAQARDLRDILKPKPPAPKN